jgi:hypothetical protein
MCDDMEGDLMERVEEETVVEEEEEEPLSELGEISLTAETGELALDGLAEAVVFTCKLRGRTEVEVETEGEETFRERPIFLLLSFGVFQKDKEFEERSENEENN